MEEASRTGSPLLMFTGVPKVFNLFWNATRDDCLETSSDLYEDDDDFCSDLAGYTCTPLARAYDLFLNLLDQNLFEDAATGHIRSGIGSHFATKITQQNGELAASLARERYYRVLATHRRVEFVWDLVDCSASFDSLHAILDASNIPMLKVPRGCVRKFRRTYGLPMLLAFTESSARTPSEIDWFTGVY